MPEIAEHGLEQSSERMPMTLFSAGRKRFSELSEQEILALAISSEEDDSRIYSSYAKRLAEDYPATAKIFVGMADEENAHRRRLIALYRQRYGETIPLLRKEHVQGYYSRKPVWLAEGMSLDDIRRQATAMESDAQRFYTLAARRCTDAATRELLGNLAEAESEHGRLAIRLKDANLDADALRSEAATERRQMILTLVQPGLAGLMDGSVSTLAPIFATAFATQDTWTSPWVSPRPHRTMGSCRGAARPGSVG